MASSLILFVAFIAASSIPATHAFGTALLPKCEYKNITATCCSALANITQSQLCVTLKVNLNELYVKASLSFNKNILIERKVEVGKLCVPVGGAVPALMVCIHFYWVEIGCRKGLDPVRGFCSNICFQASVSRIASVDFQCLRFENGKFSRNSEHEPSSTGLININIGK